MVRKLSRQYYLPDFEVQAFEQEVQIALLKAIESFKVDMKAYFASFAQKVCSNHLTNLARYRMALSRGGGVTDLSLNITIDEEEVDQLSLIPDHKQIPLYDVLEVREKCAEFISSLSDLEKRILGKYLIENDYNAIAKDLDMSLKKVNDTIYRCRKKFKRYMN